MLSGPAVSFAKVHILGNGNLYKKKSFICFDHSGEKVCMTAKEKYKAIQMVTLSLSSSLDKHHVHSALLPTVAAFCLEIT
jgi:hypothetical protein